jgi:beta-lactamase class A
MTELTAISRRHFTGGALMLAAAPAWAATPLDLKAAALAAEKATGGRVGLAVHDTVTGRRFSHRGDERFPMASTFKMLLVAAVLARVDKVADRLDRAIPVKAGDILDVSPVSKAHVGGTATVCGDRGGDACSLRV